MRVSISERPLERLHYLRASLGSGGMLRRVLHKIIAPIYCSETAYLTLTCFDENDLSTVEDDFHDQHGTECVLLTCLEELEEFSHEIQLPIEIDDLIEYFESGSNRLVILARRDNPNADGKRVIGFRTLVRGHFTHWSGRLEGKLPDDMLMISSSFVIPECRGQQAQIVMRAMTHGYAYKNGMRRLVGAVMSHNIASLRSHRNHRNAASARLLGPIKMVSIFGGFYKKMTPMSEVVRMLEHPEESECKPPALDA